MKIGTYTAALLLGLAALSACADEDLITFALDNDTIRIGAEGGTQTIRVAASEHWIATTDNPWITVSPANGRGSAQCRILIDSALTDQPRRGAVRIQTQNSWQTREIEVTQEGYPYTIEIDDKEVTISNFATHGKRYFDVKVRTNVDFDIEVPPTAGWLQPESYHVAFDRGIRPREVTVRFNWTINSMPLPRLADVKFRPKSSVELARLDRLSVTQQAAPPIEEGTRAGDSVALLGIARSLNTWNSWERSERMDNWDDVTLWEEGMEGCTPDKVGRVKAAYFRMFDTKDGLPFEVQYLTAAEELSFFSNTNTFLLNLDPGEYITQLTQLKRLTISSYGLTTLPESFTNLSALEYLDLSGNNFERIPELLTSENFPRMHALLLGANQRSLIYDLSNNVYKDLGGFYLETNETREFPRRLLAWEQLDTLTLSVNYLQGTLPTFEDDPSWPRYTDADVAASTNVDGIDTLPAGPWVPGGKGGIVGLPKVLPRARWLAINLNRLTGKAPDWLLYHPALDWWVPFILVFNQEGKDETGLTAGFSNEPANLNYYYEFFPHKKWADLKE